MQYLTNGRVVVVDDEIENEAVPLIKALSGEGIAVRFFTGRESELPKAPLGSVRLLFLDFKLEGIDFTQDPVDIARALKPVVERIIGPENGPYILFGWTKHPKYMDALVQELERKPLLPLDMDKNSCITGGVCDPAKIIAKFVEKIKELGHFNTIFEWENLVNNSAANTVNNVFTTDFNKDMIESILFCIAEAGLGKQISVLSNEQKIKSGLQCLSILLSDTIDDKLGSANFSSSPDLALKTAINQQLKSKINSKLLLVKPFHNSPCPGNAYLEFNDERKKKLKDFMCGVINWKEINEAFTEKLTKEGKTSDQIKTALKQYTEELKAKITDESRMIIVEITPICDYAQDRYQYHRAVPCFLLDEETHSYFKRTKGEAFYLTPFFIFIENGYNKPLVLFFDFRGFVTLERKDLENKPPLFRLTKQLLFDIQHKAGSHFSRPGVNSLD